MRWHLSRLALFAVMFVALANLLPSFYARATRADRYSAAVTMSPVTDGFVIRQVNGENIAYTTKDGTPLTVRAYKAQLPFMYRHDMAKWGRIPFEVAGRSFDFTQASKTQMSRLSPREVNRRFSPVNVLFEALPDGASLTMPDDLLLITDRGLQWYDVEKGAVDKPTTARLMRVLDKGGVQFPLTFFTVNPDPRKPFDDGALLVDANKALYRLQCQKGRFVLERVLERVPEGFLFARVEENRRREYRALLATDTALYLLDHAGYLRPMLAQGFDASKSAASLWITPVGKTITVRDFGPANPVYIRATALDAADKVTATMALMTPQERLDRQRWVRRFGDLISPVAIRQFKPTSTKVFFMFEPPSDLLWALGGNILWLLLFVAYRRRRPGRACVASRLNERVTYALIIVGGLPAALAALTAGNLVSDKPRPA